jgi:hypothetical protein
LTLEVESPKTRQPLLERRGGRWRRKGAGYYFVKTTLTAKRDSTVRRLEGILLPMKTEDSAGAQNIWGFGKEFETGVHLAGSDLFFKRIYKVHFIQHESLSFSNPPLEVPNYSNEF